MRKLGKREVELGNSPRLIRLAGVTQGEDNRDVGARNGELGRGGGLVRTLTSSCPSEIGALLEFGKGGTRQLEVSTGTKKGRVITVKRGNCLDRGLPENGV